ncbi:MAG: hypothetical protein O2945_01355 [Planctomycetota bacterium]|nr:hypothetical protein [Planctomycetota bacterium]MDA0917694.1 hypothetical protein [Planctomycetota bacterium]
MFASPVNQSIEVATTVADEQARTANMLTVEFSGIEHEPILLSPGKWNVGSGIDNQVVMDHDDIAARQFLIVVTEHRSVIRDWSAKAFLNGKRFDNAVLNDGDTVEIADVRMSFRLAKSQDLISQLPYVAAHHYEEASVTADADADTDGETERVETQDAVLLTADGMLAFDDRADRLDELISRVEASLESDSSEAVSIDQAAVDLQSAPLNALSNIEPEASPPDAAASPVVPQAVGQSLELQAAGVDEELRQLEELRAAVQFEREQLLAKRELLIRETQQVESQLAEVRRRNEFHSEVDQGAEFEADGFDIPEQSSGEFATRTDDEAAALAAEREKLRHYLDEFESVDDAECGQLEEVEVAVGAAQAVADYSVMNALRSREDAVKQMDDLVLAATGERPNLPALVSNSSFGPVANDRTRESSGSSAAQVGGESEFVGESDEQNHDEVSVECGDAQKLEVTDLEASFDELGALINEVEPETILADEQTDESFTHEPVSLSDDSDAEVAQELNDLAQEDSPVSEDAVTNESSGEFDLSVLMSRVDVETEESDNLQAEYEDIPQVEFDDFDSSVLSFEIDRVEDDPVEDESGTHEIIESELTESDDDEGVVPLQKSTVGEIDEFESELTAEPAGEFSFAEHPLVVESEEDQNPPTNSETNRDNTGTDDELATLEFGQLDEERPSWFDSKLMTEGDSVVEDKADDVQLAMGDAATDDGTNASADTSATDLRKKLAEMFDLPELSSPVDPSGSDCSLDSNFQQSPEVIPVDESAKVGGDSAESSWPENVDVPECSESESIMNSDPTTDSDADSKFESETLGESSSTVSDEEEEPEKSTASSFEPAEHDEPEDSISAYMERLLARNRQVTGGNSAPTGTSSKVPAAPATVVSKQGAASPEVRVEEVADSGSKPERWLEESPRHRQNRDQVRAEVQVLRQIANQSARSAVATASRRDVRKQVMVKTTASVLALGSGVAALLLEVSTPFGLVVLGIGMMFSIDLTLTIFRNWKQLRDLKKAAAALEGEDRRSDVESSEESA